MKKKELLLMLLFLAGVVSVNAQMRIGGPTIPVAGAILDLNSTNGNNANLLGLALPRVALKSANQAYPLAAHTVGMHVYNTASTSGGLDAIVQPGEYYNDGTRWIKVRSASDKINPQDISPSLKSWLINLIQAGGTNNCPDEVTGLTTSNKYKVGDFGVAGCWTTENLKDSTKIGTDRTKWVIWKGAVSTAQLDTMAYAFPNNSPEAADTLGLLYTWAAATGRVKVSANEIYPAENPRVQGICPAGWHIPSDIEWSVLESVIALSPTNQYSLGTPRNWSNDYYTTSGWRGDHGSKFKSTRPIFSETVGTSLRFDEADKTKRGFDFRLVGTVRAGAASGFGDETYVWTSSNWTPDNGQTRDFRPNKTGIWRGTDIKKNTMISVRCKMND